MAAAPGGADDAEFWEGARRRWVAAVAAAPALLQWPPGLAAVVADYLPWARDVPLRLGACSRLGVEAAGAPRALRALHALDEGGGAGPPRWVALASLPADGDAAPRAGVAALRRADGALLVTGGSARTDRGLAAEALRAAAGRTHLYCAGARRWATLAPAPAPAPAPALVAAPLPGARALLALEAVCGGAEAGAAALRALAGGARPGHAALAVERGAPEDAGCGARAYVLGGFGAEDEPLAAVACYEPARAAWRACAPLRRARAGACVAGPLPDGRLLALGGLGAGQRLLATAEVYEPLHDAWRAAPAWRLPRPAGGARLWPLHAHTTRGGAALFVTADVYRSRAPRATLLRTASWLLDLAAGVWTELPPLPLPEPEPPQPEAVAPA